MNYKSIHDSIIQRAQNRILENVYFEKHHIIPKCLGGNDEKTNIVKLTAREHFIIHWLLAEIHNTPALWYAFHLMSSCINSHQNRYTPSSRIIEYAKIQMSKIPRKHSEETKQKISKNNARWNLGVGHSDATKEKIRIAHIGKKHTDTTIEKMKESHKGMNTRGGTKNKTHRIIQKIDNCGNIIEEFTSGYGTDSYIKKTYPSIYNIIGKGKLYKGFYFQYKH